MDVIFVLMILVVLIAMGAMISVGNERQRRALEGICREAQAWSEQDLRLKREKYARDIQVTDLPAWVEQVARQVLEDAPVISSLNPWSSENAQALVAHCTDGRRLVLTPMARQKFLQAARQRGKGRLARHQCRFVGIETVGQHLVKAQVTG